MGNQFEMKRMSEPQVQKTAPHAFHVLNLTQNPQDPLCKCISPSFSCDFGLCAPQSCFIIGWKPKFSLCQNKSHLSQTAQLRCSITLSLHSLITPSLFRDLILEKTSDGIFTCFFYFTSKTLQPRQPLPSALLRYISLRSGLEMINKEIQI